MSRTPAGGLIVEGSQPLSLSKYMRSRLARAMASGAYGQIIQFGLQLIGVPLMIAAWGVERYGVWLILMTVPSYLAVADFGFTGAASNEMSMSAVRGDRHEAVSIYQALRLLLMILAASFMTLLLLALAVFGTALLDFAQVASNGHAVAIVLVMAVYGLVAIANGSVNAAFRADDRYATGSTMFQTIFLTESIAQLATVAVGGGLLEAALALCAVRVLGSIAAILLARRQVGWIVAAPGRGTLRELRAMLDPAMAGLVIPLANAIMLQGSVLTLSAAAGPAAVPVFSTARTLTRFPLQIGQIASIASISRFSVAHAASDAMLKARLAFVSFGAMGAVLIPTAIVLLVFGPQLTHLWTGGRVEAPWALIATLTLSMFASAAWIVPSNFMIAINQHRNFAFAFLALAPVALAVGYVLALRFGPLGTALGAFSLEVAMLLWIYGHRKLPEVMDKTRMREEFTSLMRHLWGIVSNRGNEAK